MYNSTPFNLSHQNISVITTILFSVFFPYFRLIRSLFWVFCRGEVGFCILFLVNLVTTKLKVTLMEFSWTRKTRENDMIFVCPSIETIYTVILYTRLRSASCAGWTLYINFILYIICVLHIIINIYPIIKKSVIKLVWTYK